MKVVEGIAQGTRKPLPAQFGLINLLKAGAAQFIVWHHLAFYGPMADHARIIAPAVIDWLSSSARIAVQVFLVIGGFLAAKSLAPGAEAGYAQPLRAIWRRYVKLAPPFFVATLIAAAASLQAGAWMTHDSISAPATLSQLSAHALLLHGVLGYASLSAGAWYVAIDFQLYALLVMMLWFAGIAEGKRPMKWLMPLTVAAGITLSLLHFNLDAEWDNWAPYFFGSYGLGMMAWWASDPRRKPGAAMLLLAMALLPALIGLTLEFRSRIALAAVVACVLFLFGRVKTTSDGRAWSAVHHMGKISYSVFLIHFPVCLLVNAAFTHFAPVEPAWQGLGMLTAWASSLLAGEAFHRWVEEPLGRLIQHVTDQLVVQDVHMPAQVRTSGVSLR
ncbi:Peptidoglycan/LPS O-acetylase OafA/YrhL, contains acyltransferase and SGNH-hydrolase domains [Duganella sacchari]|uniref:Peptidoglycan/LPS O-acetylase OafA/YrhL, contains acyltransferase and SGNH-hydrolase domains n=1 Tax=Duganella sacchari TaxID=551987 RepID=A0A1M7RCW9_9BURK|nr:acyltransferase [Duganella sacchari]SHN44155.1 Peptidoglycan/LPS O-acetylase OafA/YrhL, contains acyltransferase and SGNH-hydrolase domains [Duganella sacchari]